MFNRYSVIHSYYYFLLSSAVFFRASRAIFPFTTFPIVNELTHVLVTSVHANKSVKTVNVVYMYDTEISLACAWSIPDVDCSLLVRTELCLHRPVVRLPVNVVCQ